MKLRKLFDGRVVQFAAPELGKPRTVQRGFALDLGERYLIGVEKLPQVVS